MSESTTIERPKRVRKRRPGVGGRPSKYQREFAHVAHELARKGANVREIARTLGVVESTFWRWVGEYPEFEKAYTAGDELGQRIRDARMIRAAEVGLEKRAKGYVAEEITIQPDAEGKPQEVRRVLKDVPPDPNAAKYILGNRAGKRWPKGDTVDLGSDTLGAFLGALDGRDGGFAAAAQRNLGPAAVDGRLPDGGERGDGDGSVVVVSSRDCERVEAER